MSIGIDQGSDATSHPRLRLDEQLLSGLRLSLVAALDSVARTEFALLRDLVGVSDSVLSKHLGALERAGYLEVSKGRAGRRPRTWVAITPDGAHACRAHLRALKDVVSLDVLSLVPVEGGAGSSGS